MMTQILLIVSLATISVVTGTYVIHFPNTLIPGIPLQVRVLVQNSTGPVTVWAGLKQNESLVAENTRIVQSDELKMEKFDDDEWWLKLSQSGGSLVPESSSIDSLGYVSPGGILKVHMLQRKLKVISGCFGIICIFDKA